MMLRNKLRYLMLLALAGLLLILYNKYYIGMIFLTIVMMPFFLLGFLCYCYGRVKADLVCVTHIAEKDSKIPITIQLTNPTIFPISLVKLNITYKNAYSDRKLKKTISASVDYRTKTSVIFHITSQYAGNLEINLDSIRIYDYMKLFSLKRKLKQEIKLAVLPSYYELDSGNVLQNNSYVMDSDIYSPVKKGDDPSEVFEIREYRQGDRLQRVHWKLSMKQNQLMIKEFSDPVNCRELIFININQTKEEELLRSIDSLLECALSLSYSLLIQEHVHYLAWYDTEHGECRRVRVSKEKELFEAVDSLLQVKAYKDNVDTLSVYLSEFPHDQYSELFFISNSIAGSCVEAFSVINTSARHLICLRSDKEEVNDQTKEDEILESYKEIGTQIWPVIIGNIRNDMGQMGFE